MEKIAFQGKPLTLCGRNVKVGQVASDFSVVDQDLKEKHLFDWDGKIKLITSFPSLDTPVCDAQVKAFNERAQTFSKEVVLLAISKDLPFAQKRFCDHFAIKNLFVLSDYQTSSFGVQYGLLIKELFLLARSVMILDKDNVIRYRQVVPELTQSPNYNEAIQNLQKVIQKPSLGREQKTSHCVPCEGKVAPLEKENVQHFVSTHKGWGFVEEKKLVKEFSFSSYLEGRDFLNLVSQIAEEEGHHPVLTLGYQKLKVTLSTHAANGVTNNDLIMADMIDSLVD